MTADLRRPVIYVLAGVNGAGKSSVAGDLLKQAGTSWYNPDTFARRLVAAGTHQRAANERAWREGLDRLRRAISEGRNHAFETTLGGSPVAATLLDATRTHDVHVSYCGLASAELHIERVHARVRAGGHAIPEATIRKRFTSSPLNLIRLMPHLANLRVYDNSAPASADGTIPDPVHVLEMRGGRLTYPAVDDIDALRQTPEWAKAIVRKAIE